MKPKIVIFINTAWNIHNFRTGLIRALISEGHEVTAIAPPDEYVPYVEGLVTSYLPLPMDNNGTHPVKDFILFVRILRLLSQEKPDIFLGFTIKPNIYGSLVSQILGIPFINNVAGLGSVFSRIGFINYLVKNLYRIAFYGSEKVFFQNQEDFETFVSCELVNERSADCLPGSGIELEKFLPLRLPQKPKVRFLLIARMLWEKGVGDFVRAARIIKQNRVDAEFCLLGFFDSSNPVAISHQQMDEWVDEGAIRYLGFSDSVDEEIAKADCVVLPSYYREGTPRSLLEAAAMARPIITTDSVGCRNVVDDGISGFLVRAKDATDLADKMDRILAMSHSERTRMGLCGRKKVEREFDEKIVIKKYFDAIEQTSKIYSSINV